MLNPTVDREDGQYSWQRWKVSMAGKVPVWFEHEYAAVAHAVYVERNPVAMEDAA